MLLEVANMFPDDGSSGSSDEAFNDPVLTKARLAALLDQSAFIVQLFPLTKTGKRFANKAYELHTGYPVQEWVERRRDMVAVFEGDQERAVAQARLILTLARERRFEEFEQTMSTPFDSRVQRADGEIRWIRAYGNLVITADGDAVEYLQITTDVTDQECQRQAAVLAKENAEALLQAHEMQASVQRHELRSALTSVLGFSSLLLRDTDLEADVKNRVEMIAASARHAVDVIEASPANISHRLALEPLDVVALAQTAARMSSQQAHQMDATVSVISEGHTFAIGHDRFLLQVLVNLISNAIKYGKVSGQVLVVVNKLPDVTVIDVIDDGPGIEPALLPRLFVAGERLARTDAHGSGLGLSISKLLVDQMHGSLTVEAVRTGGSKFSITLPAPISVA